MVQHLLADRVSRRASHRRRSLRTPNSRDYETSTLTVKETDPCVHFRNRGLVGFLFSRIIKIKLTFSSSIVTGIARIALGYQGVGNRYSKTLAAFDSHHRNRIMYQDLCVTD